MAGKLIKNHKEITLSLVALSVSVLGGLLSAFAGWSYSIVLLLLSFTFSLFIIEQLNFKARHTYLLITVNAILIFSSALGMKTAFNNKSEIARVASTAVYALLNTPNPSVVEVHLSPSDFEFTSQIQQAKKIIKSEKELGNFKRAISIMESNPDLFKPNAVINSVEASAVEKKSDTSEKTENKIGN